MDRFNLGNHTREISTTSADAQRWFDRGLNWCFAFNKAEGGKCFTKALEYDPDCVMAHWGIAYASGPYYNLTWREFGEEEAKAATGTGFAHVQQGRESSYTATDLEMRLLETQAARVQQPHPVAGADYDRWDDDYAAAMRTVYHRYADDQDVMALFAEALITRTPRRLWDVRTGLPGEGSDVLEALEVCERAIHLREDAGLPQHPAILHLHIHCLEMSNEPERAKQSAERLAPLCPDAGHLNHMPAHIHMLCGDYWKARAVSQKAIAANDAYLAYAGTLTPYTTGCAHDLLLMMHACMFMGRYQDAIDAADKMHRLITKEVLTVKNRPKFSMSLEGYRSMRTHVLVRFGRWQDIIDESLPDDEQLYQVSTAMQHYAKAVAHATLKDFPRAEEERKLFHESVSRIPPDRKVFNNTAHAILAVAEKMMNGELEYHRGNHELAFDCLREAVQLDDHLEYVEPSAWMHPPRHALAALLVEQGQLEEAEQIYRDDLGLSGKIQRCAQHPDNVWALHGLAECLLRRGGPEELVAIQAKLDEALARADVPITSSCMCRTVAHADQPDSCCSTSRLSHKPESHRAT
jgi:tetratricopeptide (TPR) repeat protein